MMLISANVFERTDAPALQNALKSIARSTPVINKAIGWNGYNVLHANGARSGALDLGISPRKSTSEPKCVILMGCDRVLPQDIPANATVIYIGTHGDEGVYFADYILPGAAYTEKNGTYVNTEGRVQLGRLVVPPPGLAKDDWQILRAISEEMGTPLPYDSLEENFYMSDAISKSSTTMAKCSAAFNPLKSSNFKKAIHI